MTAAAGEHGLNPGDLFGGYQIVRKIGAGAFGAVYEALRQPLQKRVALKVLHVEHARDPSTLERFLREAQIVAQVEHPHIVAVFDVNVIDAQPYIVMELLDGQSLADRIDYGGPLTVDAVVDLMLPVFSAMATVHERGIVHRDLKPDNVFLAQVPTGGMVPKLLDFGIAKVRNAERALTATRAIMGTPNYMSPEQATESKHVDGQSDQWALAVIVFECLVGRCPIQGESLLAVLTAITSGPAPRLRAFNPALPEALEAVLLRAMERAPNDRWPSVRAFGAALLPFASPGAQAQWAQFFSAAPLASVGAMVASASPRQVTGAYDGDEGPMVARTVDVGVIKGTLAPSTRPSVALPPSNRRRAIIAVAAALVLALAAGSWLTLREGATSPAPHAASLASRVVARPSAPRPAPTVVAPRPETVAPTVAASPALANAPVNAPVNAPTAPTATPDPDNDAPSGRHHGARRPRRHRGNGGEAPARGGAFANF